jgi:hypothetical protein
MPPKGKNAEATEKLLDDEEEILQAVVLADSFNKRFRPLTTQRPRVCAVAQTASEPTTDLAILP